MFFQQATGINAVMFYAETIFEEASFKVSMVHFHFSFFFFSPKVIAKYNIRYSFDHDTLGSGRHSSLGKCDIFLLL